MVAFEAFWGGAILYFPNAAGGSTTVTLSSILSSQMRLVIEEWGGIATASPLDQVKAGSGGTGTSMTSGNTPSPTSQASELAVGMFGCSAGTATFTAGAGYTTDLTVGSSKLCTEYKILSATGIQNATGTLSSGDFWVALVATFKGSGGGSFTPAPGVTTSGTFADGQLFTVNLPAGGLGARTNPKPLYYFPMGEDGSTTFSTDNTISRTNATLTPNTGTNTIIQSSVKPVNAQGACQYTPFQGSSTTNIAFSDSPWFLTDTNADTGLNQSYIWWKRNYAFAAQPFNVKFPRYWSPTGPGGTGFPTAFVSDTAATTYAIKVDDGNGNTNPTGVPSLFTSYPHTLNTWWTDEHWWQESTINTTDGIWNGARQSGMAVPLAARWQMGTTAGPGPMFRIFGDEYSSGSPTSPNGTTDRAYLGPILVDDSFLQTVITDEGGTLQTATWRSGTATAFNREIQLQTARSDTSITFRVRKGSHASLTGKALYAYTGVGTAIYLGEGA